MQKLIVLANNLLDAERHECGRAAEPHVGTEFRQQVSVGSGDPAVRDIPDNGNLEIVQSAFRWRMVHASSSAWVGCSCAPSPPLTCTLWSGLARDVRGTGRGVPDDDAIRRHASKVFAVSMSVSPLEDAAGSKPKY
jgi:hypothetical protein